LKSGADRHSVRPYACRIARQVARASRHYPADGHTVMRVAGRAWKADPYQTSDGCYATWYHGFRSVYVEPRDPWGCRGS
jgi:hypothetical protein